MSARVTTAVEEDGRVLACKRATGEADAERLRHEAIVLTRAQHPGVVELVDCREVDGVTTLYSAFVGMHTLETAAPFSVEQAAAIVAMVASTVADLHQLGLVHGRIDVSHVLLGTGGHPVLCGFTGGGAEGEIPPPGPGAIAEFRDPAAPPDSPLSPTGDVFALGTLLRVLVIGEGPDAEPIPDRRFTLRRARPWTGYLRRALLTFADQCTDEEPLRRPSARRLAADVEALLPRADQSGERAPDARRRIDDGDDPFATLRPEPMDRSRREVNRRLTLAGTATLLALAFWGVTTLRSSHTTAAPSPAPTEVTSLPPTPTSVETSTAPVSPPSAPSTVAPPSTTPDVVVGPDGTVSMGGHTFQIGQPGDRVAIGDWNCDGSPTAAVARPDTGEIFVFDSWPSAEHEVTVTPVTRVAGAVDVRSDASAGCSVLHVVRADGTDVEVQP